MKIVRVSHVDNQDPRASAINVFFSGAKESHKMWITLKLRNAYEWFMYQMYYVRQSHWIIHFSLYLLLFPILFRVRKQLKIKFRESESDSFIHTTIVCDYYSVRKKLLLNQLSSAIYRCLCLIESENPQQLKNYYT